MSSELAVSFGFASAGDAVRCVKRDRLRNFRLSGQGGICEEMVGTLRFAHPTFLSGQGGICAGKRGVGKGVSGKKYIVEGQRLEVNPSVDRYKREMANLSAAL
jgi:hypothetical protein